MLMHRLGRLTVRLASLLVTLALVGGLPTALATVVGWPLPRRVPTDWAGWAHILTGGFPDTAVVNLLAVALWLVWAAFCYSLAGEIAAALRGRPARQLRVISPMQALAALLVAGMSASPTAATVATATPPASVVAAVPAPSAPLASFTIGSTARILPPLPATTSQTLEPTQTATIVDCPAGAVPATSSAVDLPRFAVAAQTGPLAVTVGGQHYTVTVKRGDTLWDLAGQWLSDPHRWPEIYRLNADRYDQHGRMRGGDHIEADWVLALPDDATPPAAAQATDPPSQANPTAPTAPTTPAAPGTAAPTTPADPAPSTPANPGPSAAPSAPASADPEGVVGAPTTSVPGSANPTTPSPIPSDATQTPQRHRPPGVRLPTGSWVDLGLALAVVAAVSLVWAHRRHRYTTRPPSADLRLDDPDLAPMPEVITQVRRGLRRATSQDAPPRHIDLDNDDSGLDLVAEQDPVDLFDTDEPDPTDDDVEDWEPAEDGRPPAAEHDSGQEDSDTPRPAVPALDNPLSAVWPPAGLGLTGPGAEGAARGFLAAALAAGGLDDPTGRSQVVMPAATAATLLGAAAVRLPDTPRLTVTAGLDDALEILEAQTLHRTRLVYHHEVADVAALRHADPFEEPLPPIVFIADAVAHHERARIAALLSQGQRLDIHGVLLGAWPAGNTVVVTDDGTTTPAEGEAARHGPHPADVGRLTTLNPGETADLIATLAESHTGLPHTSPQETVSGSGGSAQSMPPEVGPSGDAETLDGSELPAGAQAARDADEAATRPVEPAEHDSARPEPEATPVQAAEAGPVDTSDVLPAPAPTQPGSGDAVASAEPATHADTAAPAAAGRVEVQVLGSVRIVDADPNYHLRAKALELLVYLAVHDGAARHDAILDDLMPDAPASKAPHRVHTYVYALRKALRRTSGSTDSFINHTPLRYTLTTELFDIDLWRMRRALREAQHATDPQAGIAALRRAVDTYVGPLAEGFDYEWIDPYRQAVRQQVLDAHLALAGALEGQPAEQLTVLQAAIHHDPYAEPAYQQAIRAHAALGHLDAIRTLRRTLTRRLDEIDAEPGEDTLALADQLVAELQRRSRRPGPRPAPHPGDGAAA